MSVNRQQLMERAMRLFRSWDLASARTMSLVWVCTRVLLLFIWALFTPESQGDVVYYYEHITAMHERGPAQTMPEYPTPVLWMLDMCWYLGLGTQVGYVVWFVLAMLACDAALYRRLWLTGGRLGSQAAWFWTVFITAIGPTVYLRFDIVTSVLTGWSLLWLAANRPRTAGGLAGLGAAIKLWPALLWPALCGTRGRRAAPTLAFWFSGGVLGLASFVWAGWDRLISPLTWQSGRGLQVESVWATVPMLLRAFGGGDYTVAVSRYQAFEIFGPHVVNWSVIASVAMPAGLIGLLIGYLWWLRGDHQTGFQAAILVIAVVLMIIVTNKTFSPQYMIWLGGPTAAAIALLGLENRDSPGYLHRRSRIWMILLMVLAASLATTMVFPIGYDPLVRDSPISGTWRPVVTIVLAIRNMLICAMTVLVADTVLGFLRAPDRTGEG